MEHIAPHWLQAAGRQGDVIVERPSGQVCDEPHPNSRWHEEGIVSRVSLETLFTLLMLHRWRNEGFW